MGEIPAIHLPPQTMSTLDAQLAFAKELIQEQDHAYQQHFAAGRFDEMMTAKRELSKQRNLFGKLLKQKMRFS
jgi:hypothetical protein